MQQMWEASIRTEGPLKAQITFSDVKTAVETC